MLPHSNSIPPVAPLASKQANLTHLPAQIRFTSSDKFPQIQLQEFSFLQTNNSCIPFYYFTHSALL